MIFMAFTGIWCKQNFGLILKNVKLLNIDNNKDTFHKFFFNDFVNRYI